MTFANNETRGGSGGSGQASNGAAGAATGDSIFNLKEAGSPALTLRNSLLAQGVGGSGECASELLDGTQSTAGVTLAGNNLIRTNQGCGTAAATAVAVLALADNGGLTQTHALPIATPRNAAIDTADATVCAAYAPTDQRGIPRPRDGGSGSAVCDVGSFEADLPYDLTISNSGPASMTRGTAGTFTLHVTNHGPAVATNIILTNPTPSGLQLVSATLPCASGFPCNIGDLRSGADFVVTVIYFVPLSGPGSFTSTATVSADLPADESASADNTSSVTVTTSAPLPAATTTTLATSATPTRLGQPVTFSATVASSTTPTGFVTFTIDSAPQPAAQLAGGVATLTTSTLSVGTHVVSASFAGDGVTIASSSGSLTGGQTVIPADSATTLTSSANPVVSGQPITFTANVGAIAPGAGSPTGSVTFSIDDAPIGTAPMASGAATFSYSSALSIGAHVATAAYSGDSNFNTSIGSLDIPQLSNPDATSVTITPTANPAIAGNSVTFTAHATANPPGAGVPTGSIAFSVDGGSPTSVAVDASGAAAFSQSFAIGSHSIQAVYSGDSNFLTSTGSLSETVSGGASFTALSASPSPAVFGQLVTLQAT
ncbi:MAG TPA: Ig-like domain repeat protein, partial [Thermoanaerobaculia bacterium]|nr:Ig-like domain repeat protein [Thermoanaerobaculia bacterium]